jgi:hypothetical protein
MKKSVLLIIFILFVNFTSAICNPTVSLISQDPYPANPGEYVKLVFQVDSLGNSDCGNFKFELLEKYPLIFDPGQDSVTKLNAGFYDKDYGSFLIAPYKVRIDTDALDGDTIVETTYQYGDNQLSFLNSFNITVEDTRADFELHINKYSYTTNEMSIEILNIDESDVEALKIQIPTQEDLVILGSNSVVVGDLDSNEFTDADFKLLPKKEKIDINLIYTDNAGNRREIKRQISFDSELFENTKPSSNLSWQSYLLILIIIGFGIWYFLKRKKSNKKRRTNIRGNVRLN